MNSPWPADEIRGNSSMIIHVNYRASGLFELRRETPHIKIDCALRKKNLGHKQTDMKWSRCAIDCAQIADREMRRWVLEGATRR